jgi:hypothetical protein
MQSRHDDDDGHVDVLRLRLWTVATNGPIFHPPGDTWALRTMMEWCRRRKTPDSSTRALRQSYHQSYSVVSRRNGEGNDEFGLAKYFCLHSQVIFTCHKVLRHGANGFTSPPKEGVLRIFTALKDPSPSLGLNPRTLAPTASTQPPTLSVALPKAHVACSSQVKLPSHPRCPSG